MTVAENMGFALKIAGRRKEEISARVAEAAKILDLGLCLDRKPKALSGGQRQRVAMGRATVRSPQVFLMDEPLSNLDAKLRVQTRTQIAARQRRLGTTTVYVTHDQVEAMTMGDRFAVLKDGVLAQSDTPLRLYQQPASVFVAGFIGSPGMNIAEFKLDGTDAVLGQARVRLATATLTALAEEGADRVGVGFRPESVDLVAEDDPDAFPVTVAVVEELGSDAFLHGSHSDLPGPARSAVIAVCGEALIDLVDEGDELFRAHPGGSPANVAVGLSRLGIPVALIARVSQNTFGRLLRAHLIDNGVDLRYVVTAAELSTLAVVSLDGAGVASYAFYTGGTADWQWESGQLPAALPAEVVALHSGSLALCIEPAASVVPELLRSERARGQVTICLDPNVPSKTIRPRHGAGSSDGSDWRGLLAAMERKELLGAPNRSALAAVSPETLATVIDEAALVAASTCSRRGADSPTRDQVTAYGRNRSKRSDTPPLPAAGPLARAE
jgi:ABC-type sugar transport system ATPase subunit/sugar/nucleoside kinase (ribokinase family)